MPRAWVQFLVGELDPTSHMAQLKHRTNQPTLLFQSLVVKPDQLIKRRGKLGLVGVNLTLDGVKSWLKPRLGQEATVSLGVGLGVDVL